jgi:flagellar biosynthetic protein FliQ
MTAPEILQTSNAALWVILKMSLPLLLTVLVVGLVVSFIQALTQTQEMTLSFIPKIVALFIALILFIPFIAGLLNSFTLDIFNKISGAP